MGWVVFAILPAFVALLIGVHAGHILQIAFTPVAVLIGLFLCFRFPQIYLALIIVLVAFAPLVSRLTDYQVGYTDPNPVSLAAPLVCLLACIRLIGTNLFSPKYVCFVLPFLAACYGFVVGVLMVGGRTVLTAGVGWFFPLFVGLYCALFEDEHQRLSRIFLNTLGWSAGIAGIYGVVQYFWPAPWDTYWLTQVQLTGAGVSWGTPVPLGIRVFSTLNAPEPAAVFLGVGLIALIVSKTRWRYLLFVPIIFSLALTAVRSEWLALIGAGILLILKASAKARLQLIVALAVLIPLLIAGANTPPGESITKRFASLNDLSHDNSAQERTAGVKGAAAFIINKPFGQGVGILESQQFYRFHVGPVGGHDLGILELPFSLGYLGTLLYGIGVLIAIFTVLGRGLSLDYRNLALAIIALHTLLLLATNNPFSGAVGFFFWGSTGLILGFLLHYRYPALSPGTGSQASRRLIYSSVRLQARS
jgi:hypothetical protein